MLNFIFSRKPGTKSCLQNLQQSYMRYFPGLYTMPAMIATRVTAIFTTGLHVINRYQGDNALGSVHPSVCPPLCLSAPLSLLSQLNPQDWSKEGQLLCVVTKNNKIIKKQIVCVSVIRRLMWIILRMRSFGF